MSVLRRPYPRFDERRRSIFDGQPMWMLAAQFYLFAFVWIDFNTISFNPKPEFLLNMMLLGAIVLLAPRGTLNSVRISIPVLLFTSWWMVSYIWSPIPGTWINKSIQQLAAFGLLTVVMSVLPLVRLIKTWLAIVYAMLVYTFIFTAMHPATSTVLINYTTTQVVNVGWHGPFNHKNNMASFMVFGMILVLSFEKRPWVRRLAVLTMVFLVVMSRSGTGAGALVATMLSLYWCRKLSVDSARRRASLIVVSFFTSVVALSMIVTFSASLASLYGKDLSFSGRTEIWKASITAIRQKPWTGYSWGGIWIDPTTEPTRGIVKQLGFIVFHAHNGPIELMLELGIVGFALYMYLWWSTLSGGWRMLRSNPALAQTVVSYCVMVFISSISEVLVIGPWLSLLVALNVWTLRAAGEERRAKAARENAERRARVEIARALADAEQGVRS